MIRGNESIQAKNVTILTGFLGSGKTTLLNAILRQKPKTRFAIIENEVGEIGIDGELIVKNNDSFTALNNGCICCSINEDFNQTLKTLARRNDWDELIIEATGIANPGGIIAPFLTFPWMQKHFQMPQVICIADAQNMEAQLKLSDTAAEQLAYADKVLINKVDLVNMQQIKRSVDLVTRFNPFASIHTGSRHELPLSELLCFKNSDDPYSTFQMKKEKAKHHHNHKHYEAVSLEYSEPFNENKLYAQLYYHLMSESVKLYRFKGIFFDSRKSEKIIIQSAMKSLLAENGEPWKEEESKTSKFVFIGKHLNSDALNKLLISCHLVT